MIIPWKVPKYRRYEAILRVLHVCVAPFTLLTETDIKVLGQLLYYYNEDQSPIEDRNRNLFDYDTKVKICNTLDLTMPSLENCLMGLRKSGYILGLRKTRTLAIVDKLNNNFFDITFKIMLK